MRISCPYCGDRDAREFTYHGAHLERPDPAGPGGEAQLADYIYIRENPAGPLEELWVHRAGCRSWVCVTRDTRTHEILGVTAMARVTLMSGADPETP